MATAFIQKHFGNPIVRRPFHMNYMGKEQVGDVLTHALRKEEIRFLDKKDFQTYHNNFRNELLKVGILNGIQFILFHSKEKTLYLDIVPSKEC